MSLHILEGYLQGGWSDPGTTYPWDSSIVLEVTGMVGPDGPGALGQPGQPGGSSTFSTTAKAAGVPYDESPQPRHPNTGTLEQLAKGSDKNGCHCHLGRRGPGQPL